MVTNPKSTDVGTIIPLTGNSFCKIDIAGYSIDGYKTFDPSGYTVLCELGKTCDGLAYFPNTAKIVLSVGGQSRMVHNFETLFITDVANKLSVSEVEAVETISNFFTDKQVTVQPIGLQGKVYNAMRGAQNYVPMAYMTRAVVTARTLGLTGVGVITQAPLTFVGATYVGAIFFGYCGIIAGNTPVGLICNSTSYVLSRPMAGCEIVLNGLILQPVSNVTGLPLVLNGTAELLAGTGITIKKYRKIALGFEKIINSKAVKKIKKIYKVIRGKD